MPIQVEIDINGNITDMQGKLIQLGGDFDKFIDKSVQGSKATIDTAKNMQMAWTEFRSMYSTVLDVVRGGQAVWAGTVGEFTKYAGQVALVSRTAGTTAEEASRLIQVVDDMGVTFEELNVMMRKMTMEGTTPSIEALAALSEQYIAIQDPAERAKFLLDNFGRAGAEAGRLMEQGAVGILAMNAAIDENLILTNTSFKSAEEYRLAVDRLSDSWTGFKISLGGGALPFALELLDKINAEIAEEGGLLGVLKQGWVNLLGPIGAVISLIDLMSNKTVDVKTPTATAPVAKMGMRGAHASGGSFLIPQSYGTEGFRLGNSDTASGGERITITPAGGAQGQGIDYQKLARAFRDALAQAG